MKIGIINSYNVNSVNKFGHADIRSRSNQSFTGLTQRVTGLFHTRAKNAAINEYMNRTGYYLMYNPAELKQTIAPKTVGESQLLFRLTENYVSELTKKHQQVTANTLSIILNVYNSISKRTTELADIVKINTKSIGEYSELFKLAGKDKQKNELLKKLLTLKSNENQMLDISQENIIKILSSGKAKKLNKNFEKFRSYIILNSNNENFAENLIKELQAKRPSFKQAQLNRQLNVRKAKSESYLLGLLPDKFLEENYNPLGFKLFRNYSNLIKNIVPDADNISQKDLDFIASVISTTNKKNFAARTEYFENDLNYGKAKNSKDDILVFFNRMDKDENFRKLYEKTSAHITIQNIPLQELMMYADIFGSKNLLDRSENFVRMLKYDVYNYETKKDFIAHMGKRLNNRFYITNTEVERAREEEYYTRLVNPFFGNTKANLKRYKRKFKYDLMPKVLGTGKQIKLDMKQVEEKLSKIEALKPQSGTNILRSALAENLTPVIAKPASTPQKAAVPNIAAQVSQSTAAPVKLKIKRDYKQQKLLIKEEAQKIIKSRMRSKKDYSANIKNFTKMRNELLPLMFNSVKETRAFQRAQGIKRPNVSNSDVISLYEKINGKNKKLAKYLLTKRKENGELEFNVKQISKLLDEIQSKRPPKQSINTKI